MKREPLVFSAGGIDDGVVRIRLRREADLPAVVEACQDPAIKAYTRVPDDYDLAKAKEYAAWAQHEAVKGRELSLLMVDAEKDSLVGSIGFFDYSPSEGRCEIGYWLAPWARGRGLMERSVRLLCGWIFEELPIERISAGVEPANEPSHAMLARVGFSREGIARSLFEMKGRRRDVVVYSLLRGELEVPSESPQRA